MASLALLAAITQVRRIAENRSDSIVMVGKKNAIMIKGRAAAVAYRGEGWGVSTHVRARVFSSLTQVEKEALTFLSDWKKPSGLRRPGFVFISLMSHVSFSESA